MPEVQLINKTTKKSLIKTDNFEDFGEFLTDQIQTQFQSQIPNKDLILMLELFPEIDDDDVLNEFDIYPHSDTENDNDDDVLAWLEKNIILNDSYINGINQLLNTQIIITDNQGHRKTFDSMPMRLPLD